MAKTASKYISFDSDGRLFADETVGIEEPAGAEAPENPSLKAAVAYALDAIVDAASALPENAAALIAPAPKAERMDPEEATLTVGCDVRSTIGDDFAVTATEGADGHPRALVVASAKNARAFVGPMEQAGLDVVFATVDNRSLDGFARRQLPPTTWAAPRPP